MRSFYTASIVVTYAVVATVTAVVLAVANTAKIKNNTTLHRHGSTKFAPPKVATSDQSDQFHLWLFSTYVSLNVDDLCSLSGIRRGSIEILDRERVAKPIEPDAKFTRAACC